MLLGDVCYCREETEGYSLGIALSHSILEMTALGHLMDRLLKTPITEQHRLDPRPDQPKPADK
jgi:hypothetical protein